MVKRILMLLLSIPAAAFLVTLAVSNRHIVRLVLDPFNPENPTVSLPLPFYVFLFSTLVLGVFLGGMATWMTQSKWRQTARRRTQEAMRWQAEADRLARERDARVAAGQSSPAPIAGSAKRLTASPVH